MLYLHSEETSSAYNKALLFCSTSTVLSAYCSVFLSLNKQIRYLTTSFTFT